MRIAVSNIAWPAEVDWAAYALLAEMGVAGIEIAPTRVWPGWEGISDAAVGKLRREIEAEGLRVSSLQSILFQKPTLQLFSEGIAAEKFAQHLRFCAGLAAGLGAGAVVFGAPKNRDRGALSEEAAFARAVEVFTPIAEAYAAAGVALCLEANPAAYACNFVTHASEAARLVRAVGSAGLRLHLDTACAGLSGDDVAGLVLANSDILTHFHASEPMLGAFAEPSAAHGLAAKALREVGYKGWVAVEMRAQEDALAALEVATRFAVETYGEAR
jgi:D-psicose/D-tagatose/L-ribulose 3-epimerase